MNKNLYVDTPAIVQVLGSIFLNPNLLDKEEYTFVPEDFPQDFHKVLYESFYNLKKLGVKNFTADTIEDYLKKSPEKFGIYKVNNGRKYLEEISSRNQMDAFDFYYGRLKKFTLLRGYSALGLNLEDIYDPSTFDTKLSAKQEERLNNSTLEFLADIIQNKVEDIKIKYVQSMDIDLIQSGRNALDLIQKYKETPAFGYPLYCKFSNTIFRGARRKKFYIRSAATGVGKTRMMIADACTLGCDEYFDLTKREWVSLGTQVPTLYISSEMDEEEITTIQLAFISGVQEDKIVMGEFNPEEEARLIRASDIIGRSKLKIKILSDYNLNELETIIKTANRKNGINVFFFDYLHSTQKILNEVSTNSGVKGLQEYNILFLIAVKLKDLCNELNCFIMTATQLNGEWQKAKIFDQNLLRGAKAIADKIDAGCIMLDVTKEDLEVLAPVTVRIGTTPNIKMSVYKNRGNKYNNILIWYKANKGIARFEPLFITNYQYELIEDIDMTEITLE